MRVRNCWFNRFFGLLVISFLALPACSAESSATQIAKDVSSAGNETGNAGTAGDNPGGSPGSSGTGGVPGNPLGEGGDDGTEDFTDAEVCARDRVDPVPIEIEVPVEVPEEVTVPVPIAIYLMIDRSSSMAQPADPNVPETTKWDIAYTSIEAFITNEDSDFLDVGVQYFSGMECDEAPYIVPAVDVGPLPDNATNILNSLSSSTPTVEEMAFTPMEPALRGMTAFCAQYQTDHPDEECVGVLISDGAPTACATEENDLVKIVQDAYDDSDVRTFTVGMLGADIPLLDSLALWGGTDCTPNDTSDGHACDVSSGMTLIEAFEAIRKVVTRLETKTVMRTEFENRIADCEWGLPDTPEAVGGEGEEFNKDKVNVIFYDPNKGEEPIRKIPVGADCSSVSGGWYYDDEENPTKIIVCDQTCDHITSIEGAIVDFELGCDTLVLLR